MADPIAIALLCDAIERAIDRGDLNHAIELYFGPLGRFAQLGDELGQYLLGERAARMLADATADLQGEPRRIHNLMLTDWAIFLVHLGRLEEAEEIHQRNASSDVWCEEPAERAIILANLAACRLRQGRVRSCQEAVRQGLAAIDGLDDPASEELLCLWQAESSVLLGDAESALDGYRRCLDCQDRLGQEGLPLYQLRGFHFQWTLLWSGLADEAEAQARAVLPIHRQNRWGDAIARSQIVLAECARRMGRLEEARRALEPVWLTCRDRSWAELALYCLLIDTWLLHDLGLWEESADGAREGLEVAQGCGYVLLAVDFKCALARAMLQSGEADAASTWATNALESAEDNLWGRAVALELTELTLRAQGRGKDTGSVGAAIEKERQRLARLRDGLKRFDFRV